MRAAELHIAEASLWATALVSKKGPSKTDPYSKVARELGPDVPRSKIWSLVHRPHKLKSIASHIREGLANAYAAECERQRKLYEHERAIAIRVGGSPALIRAADALAGINPAGEANPQMTGP